ncbi:hypothetical protein GE09DRAFT_1045767 [Coniochaeta sp. 2T2.1]|nr:hypothetical protein GE09DRAFT_1045767 [Coniochaeta sp. 2T2.1]
MTKLRRDDYTVGWICPLEVEQTAALAMLDEEHDRLPQPATDHNVYTLGRIAGHNVVIAGLYQPGNNPAATVVTQMRTTFPNLKFGLLVGIGGGVPVRTDTGMIRLGHVVVSKPAGGHSGAVQYDHGKAKAGRFERTGALAPPPAVLLGAAQDLAAKRARAREDPLGENIKRIDTSIRTLRRYKYPGAAEDRLHRPGYEHRQPVVPCDECGCDPLQRIVRPTDDEGDEGDEPYIAVHRGTIASGELVVKDALLRDRLAEEGLLCFEMEAAGALADFPCIVIRGISDYCDSHKNDQWHGYAAAAAAAYARQLFFHMPVDEVERIPEAAKAVCSYPLHELAPVAAFVQRPILRDAIREQLTRAAGEQGGGPRKVGVWGFGGGGKSQLALSYLQHYRDDYDATFWIQAGQPASIDRDFVEIRRLLPHSASGESNGPEEVRQDVLAWFARRTGKWLFVFDGADHLDKRDEKFTDFLRYIPQSPGVHVVFTSRSTGAKKLSTFGGVRVAELEEDQAVTLFLKHVAVPRTRGRTEEEARAIVEELGRLALAVTIAASYVADTPRLKQNLTQYLEEFRRRRRQLLDRLPDGLADEYDHSIMTVWETSYAAVHDRLPAACRLLTLLAFVNYEDIFLELFGLRPDAGGEEVAGRWMSVVSDQAMDLQRVEECFAVLERYSLVQQQADAEAYSIHRLVHAWDRDRLGAEEIDRFCRAALEMLYSATQDCGDGPETKRRLVPHLRANFDEVARLGIDAEEEAVAVVDCVEAIGVFTADIGSWGEAAAMKKEVLEKRQRILGDEHPDTITAMNNLAITLGDMGKREEAAAMRKEAAAMRKEVLEKMQRILGDEHPATISAMNNFAITLGDMGKREEAAAMKKEVLEKRQRILGDEHPDTITAMNNLAITLGDMGKREEAAAMRKEAAAMKKEVLEKRRMILGDEHPDTISAMGNLANTLGDMGKLEEAAAMKKEVLEKRQRILGDEHPASVQSKTALAANVENLSRPPKRPRI